MAQGASA